MLTKIFAMLYPVTLTLLRIFAGFLFWERGASKLLGWFGGNQADFFSLLWIAAILEFLGGIAIVAGLFTRPVAFILAGEMAVAFFTVHFPGSFWPIVNRGELPVLFCFIFLLLATTGPGKLSVETLLPSKTGLRKLFSRFYLMTLTLLRIVTGVVFWQFGAAKLFGMFGGNQPELLTLRWFAGVLEFFGGLLIVGGLYTRPVAFLLSGEMATAFFLSHFPRGYWPIQNGGERAVLFCFIYFFLATAGPGRLSLDGLIAVRSSKR